MQENVLNGAKVLVVDDTVVNLQVVKGILKKTGIEVFPAPSGAVAVEMTKTIKFDLILMDHMMPEMDGEEALKIIKSQEGGLNFDTPVIAQTANVVGNPMEGYARMGFSDYIPKPLNAEGLIKKLEEWLSK